MKICVLFFQQHHISHLVTDMTQRKFILYIVVVEHRED